MAHAKKLGLKVVEQPLPGKVNAVLLPGGTVVLNSRRTAVTKRYALAHECGHWRYGHDWRYSHDRERDEFQADRYAAGLLINEIEYAKAETLVGPHAGAIARELLVPVDLVNIWRKTRGFCNVA